ncbi:MAG: ATP-binding cassette domain-containing protein [Betaproteobacteria bacterium]|nr:ATP-binding cassette domain-containing protein [Betaproteobacteria bacterium]
MQIRIDGLSARHRAAATGAAAALRQVSLTIGPGEQVAIIGPSGAGKTTLLNALACALKPAAGKLALDGTDPWRLSVAKLQKLRGRLFLAPQTPPLPPRQRVITAVLAARLPHQSLLASLRSLIYPTHIAEAEAALAHFDLANKLWDRVDRLSGGERQRVGLSRALVSQASLWLIDEPLSSLDPSRAALAIESLTQAAKRRNATLVTTLHQVDVATRFARVIGLRDGELKFDLPSREVTRERLGALYAQYEHELTSAAPVVGDPAQEDARSAVMYCR